MTIGPITRGDTVQFSGTAAELAALNPVIGRGRFGYAEDTHVLKIGDDVTAWNALPSFEERSDPQVSEFSGVIQNVNTAAYADIVNLAPVNFSVLSIPWVVELELPWVLLSTIATSGVPTLGAAITDQNGVAKRAKSKSVANNAGAVTDVIIRERIVAAGDYTRKAQVLRTGASAVLQLHVANDNKYVATLTARPER